MYVNLVNLAHCRKTGERIRIFSDLEDLREYTRASESRIFSRFKAKAQGPLRYLLRKISSPKSK
ncbi:hypothetical protein F4814DRAFT_412965 [Daldinia grandis]|nr:hypothetical protein F4814DRAFT_412965 [Daldinia grandis]